MGEADPPKASGMGHYVLNEGLSWDGAGKVGQGPKPLGFVLRVGHFAETSKPL